MKGLKTYVETHKERFLNELFDLLKLPSVSADSAYEKDVIATAKFVAKSLEKAGCTQVELCETKGYPIVYAEKLVDPKLPTVLVYGHYDVQPADPIELWDSPPFEPLIKTTELHPEGAIFARGACDDKGQMYMHIKALEFMTSTDQLPCNVKFMIEGEEEVGSENLGAFVAEQSEKLSNDVILISDTGMISKDTPSITTGLRGLSYVEVEVTGPNRDLHSGVYGGAVANPITILSKMIAACHDENNHITIPGFYDDVIESTDVERAKMAEAPFDLNEFKQDLGIANVWGEKGYSTNERTGIRPTLEVNGIWGGYTGEGAKTVLPSKAFAKISCRLVPNQSSKIITEKVLNYFKSIAPDNVTVNAFEHHGGEPYITPIDSHEYQSAAKAIATTFGKDPIPVRGGGSIPICSLFEQALGLKIVFMGFGLDSDNLHSPNEKYDIVNFYKGIETIPYFHQYFAEKK